MSLTLPNEESYHRYVRTCQSRDHDSQLSCESGSLFQLTSSASLTCFPRGHCLPSHSCHFVAKHNISTNLTHVSTNPGLPYAYIHKYKHIFLVIHLKPNNLKSTKIIHGEISKAIACLFFILFVHEGFERLTIFLGIPLEHLSLFLPPFSTLSVCHIFHNFALCRRCKIYSSIFNQSESSIGTGGQIMESAGTLEDSFLLTLDYP